MSFRTIRRQMPRRMPSNVRVYYWDIESWGLNPKNVAFMMVMPEKRYHKRMKDEYLFKTGQEMLEWVDSLPKSFHHIFYAHNGNAFDIYALFDAHQLADMKKLANPSTVFSFEYRKNVIFRDSRHLLSAPLSAYGAKGITPKKFIDSQDPDFGNIESITPEDVDYCRLDVVILRDALVTLRTLYREWCGKRDADLPLTAASMAYRVWCSRFWPQEWVWEGRKKDKVFYSATFPDAANECAKRAFYGGRVMVFPGLAGERLNNVMSYDRNSMYPAEMLNQILPNADKVFKAQPSVGRVHRLKRTGSPYWGHFVLEARKDADLFLPQMVEKKAFYLGKSFDGALMWPEVNYALDNGWDLKEVKELWRSEPIEPFREYVDFFYSLRLEMKANGDRREKFVKILLNSLYGKFGSKDRHERIEDKESIERIMLEDDWRDRYEVKPWSNLEHETGFYLVSLEATIRPQCNFFPIAAAITSHARVNLQSNISAAQREGFKVAYCDTDSIHFYDLTPGERPPISIGSDLGEWDLERPKGSNDDVVHEAVYYERKAYTWKDRQGNPLKVKHKGVSESDGDLTKPQKNVSVRKYKMAKRRGLEAGVEVVTMKKSKKWVVE